MKFYKLAVFSILIVAPLAGATAFTINNGTTSQDSTETRAVDLQNGTVVDFGDQDVQVRGPSGGTAQVCENVTFMTNGAFILNNNVQSTRPNTSAALFASREGMIITADTKNAAGQRLADQVSPPGRGFMIDASVFAIGDEDHQFPAITVASELYDVGATDLGPINSLGVFVGGKTLEVGRGYDDGTGSGFTNSNFNFPAYLRQENVDTPPGMDLQIGQVDVKVTTIEREYKDSEEEATKALSFFNKITF